MEKFCDVILVVIWLT